MYVGLIFTLCIEHKGISYSGSRGKQILNCNTMYLHEADALGNGPLSGFVRCDGHPLRLII